MRKQYLHFAGRTSNVAGAQHQPARDAAATWTCRLARPASSRKAGYCLATLLRLPQGGPQVAVVVLGAKSNAGRFWETRHLFNWMSGKASDSSADAGPARRSPPRADE